MRIKDKAYLAWHNIKQNPSRSILTTFMVYILSILMMGLAFIGISFTKNMNKVYECYVSETGIRINYSQREKILQSKLDEINILFDKYDEIITDVSTYTKGFLLYDFKHSDLKLSKGTYQKEYQNQPYIYLCEEDSDSYEIGENYVTDFATFTIMGFHQLESSSPVADFMYFSTYIEPISMFTISCGVQDTAFKKGIQATKHLFKALQEALLISNSTLECEALEVLNRSDFITGIGIGALCILTIILILLSIGTISNSIIISLDQNRQFIALQKILGLKNKDIFHIVLLEVIMTIFFGIFLSSLTLIGLLPVFSYIVKYFLEFFLGNYFVAVSDIFVMQISYPIYVPFIFILLFVLFTLAFAKKGLMGIVCQTPIEVMSEVNRNEK